MELSQNKIVMAATKKGIAVNNKQLVIKIDQVKIDNRPKITVLWFKIVQVKFMLFNIEDKPFKCKDIIKKCKGLPS